MHTAKKHAAKKAAAKKTASKNSTPAASKAEALLQTGQRVKLKGDKRAWRIIGINADNYRILFEHEQLESMSEEKNVAFDAVTAVSE